MGDAVLRSLAQPRWLSPNLASNPTSLAATAAIMNSPFVARWASGQDALGQGPNAALGRSPASAPERLAWVIFAVGLVPPALLFAGGLSAWRRAS